MLPSQKEFLKECLPEKTETQEEIIVWGDSHAAHLYPGLAKIVSNNPLLNLVQLTTSGCPPIKNHEILNRPNCKITNDLAMEIIARRKPTTLIIAANWAAYFDPTNQIRYEIGKTFVLIKKMGIKNVIVVGQTPLWKIDVQRIALKNWLDSGVLQIRNNYLVVKDIFRIDKLIKTEATKREIQFKSPLDYFCNTKGCMLTIFLNNQLSPTTFDNEHLTAAASDYLVKSLLAY